MGTRERKPDPMKRRYKIAGGFVVFIAIAVSALAVVLSYDSACGPAPQLAAGSRTMEAVVYRCYGSADVLRIEAIEKPAPGDDELLVRVRAAAVNPLDWHFMRGSPYIMRLGSGVGRPTDTSLGVDFAGTVEAVGKDVERFEPGDEVFGGAAGAFGEYVTIQETGAVAHKPTGLAFEQAAAMPIAAVTALEALRDKSNVQPGDRVLINGASGGVGTFAVQIAKAFGAEVHGVCSTRNVEMVRSLGADHVFDYTQENYTEGTGTFDVIIDLVGNHSVAANRRVLAPDGALVLVGGPKGNWVGPLKRPIEAAIASLFEDEQQLVTLLASMRQEDLITLAELARSGKVTPVIDRRYTLAQVPEAIRYSESGRARGKIIVTFD